MKTIAILLSTLLLAQTSCNSAHAQSHDLPTSGHRIAQVDDIQSPSSQEVQQTAKDITINNQLITYDQDTHELTSTVVATGVDLAVVKFSNNNYPIAQFSEAIPNTDEIVLAGGFPGLQNINSPLWQWQLNPGYVYEREEADTYIGRGVVKAELGDKQGAILDYDRIIKINPNDAIAYYNRGLVKAKLGDKQGARSDFDRVLKINPNSASAYAYTNRGVVKAELGDK